MLLHSLEKYGFDSHKMEMIHELPKDVDHKTLSSYEIIYIGLYKYAGARLMNLTNGGDGSHGYKHTDEAKIKMSQSGKGRFVGDKNPNYGKGCFGERNGAYGKDRRNIVMMAAKANEKPVYQYSKDGVLIRSFESATKAAILLNLKVANISACCLGKPCFKTAGGFIWKYDAL